MRFRFTLTHRGSEAGPFAIPALSFWDTQVGADNEWSLGPVPSVTLPGTTFGGDFSEYLYVSYGFEAGVEYSITVEYTKTYLSGISNPRTIRLHILDDSFASVFSETVATPTSPGGTGSVTLSFTATTSCKKIAIKVADGSEVTFTIDSVTGVSVDPNDVTETLEINEPDGWRDAILKLARDKDYRSLIEFFDGSFIFYGDNGVVNGGIDFIKRYEQIYGPDVNLEMLIELTLNDVDYETVFSGQLDLSLAEEMVDNKIRVPIIRDNFWAKFYSRKDTPVDLHAAVDLDGNAVADPVDSINLMLPSQIITYYSEFHEPFGITYDTSVNNWVTVNWSEEVQKDISLFTIVRTSGALSDLRILGLFEAPWDGEYTIEVKFSVAIFDGSDWTNDSTSRLMFTRTQNSAVNGDRLISLNSQDIADGLIDTQSSGSDSWLVYQPTLTFTMYRGEQMAILYRESGDPTIFGETELIWKVDCDVATTVEITLSGEQTIDGVLTATSRVLVKNQTILSENGIYESSAGAWTRTNDADSASELMGIAVYVVGGANQDDTSYMQVRDIGTLGSDPVVFELTDNSEERLKVFPGYALGEVENYIKITAKTRFRSTEQPASLIHDAAAKILKSYGLGEDNPFYSEIMGSSFTLARQYEQDGCAWRYAILRGLQLRGYTLAEKPFFLSFNEWWKGVNPIFNLGLTYETIEGSSTDPTEVEIQPLLDEWADAGGPNPGAWNYAAFTYPFTSVNGNGGIEGYTVGTMPAVGGETYVITTVTEIFETGGVNPVDITLIFAILDAGFNELDTVEFNYNSVGFKVETFLLTPPTDGTYFGLRVVNDTPFDTKSLVLRMAVGETVEQLLLNEDFDDASVWTNEGAGSDWSIGGGEASITGLNTITKALTQEFSGGEVGDYHFISEFVSTNFGGGDTADLTLNFYDSGNNLVSTKTELIFSNETQPLDWFFTSLVPVTKVEIILEVTGGSSVDLTIPYAGLFIIVPTEVIVVPDEQVIRVENVEYFYDPDRSLNISNIRNVTRKYDNDKIYNKINVGYNTWKSEDIQGIDDTQTQHIYASKLERIGQTITLWSEFIAASLAIEATRRKLITESTDYKFDDSTFIISINPDDVSPDTYSPELNENFSDIDNLLDEDNRYNTRLSVARNFLRWRKWFNGCLQNMTNSFYKFVRGEGNFDMISTMVETSPDCLDESYESQPLSEKQDIEVTDEYIHLPNLYEFEVPMTWEDYKTIRNNRTKAIGVSLSDQNHIPLFIDQLDYSIMHGFAKVSGWTTQYWDIAVLEDEAAEQVCLPALADCLDAITDDLGEMLTTETGACITA